MKKLTIIALALCLAVVMAAPVMAVDADFSGEYRVRGMYTEHWDLDKDSASNAYMDMRFRLQTVFKASDNLSVTTRFDALDDKVWGEGSATVDSIDFDRAYMTIKTDFGKFDLGRMSGGAWGTSFVDNEDDYDRIKYTKVIDNLTLNLVFQKNTENDVRLGTGAEAYAAAADAYTAAYTPVFIAAIADGSTTVQADTAANTAGDIDADAAYEATLLDAADEDSETYYLLGTYKMENITSGLLLSFNNDKTTTTQTTHKYSAIPYFVAKFGQLGIQGELAYNWGETDFDDTTPDEDIKQLAYNVEASYNFGVGSVMAGYAFVSGDNDTTDNEDSAYGHVGADWEKLFILTYDESPVNNLGGSTKGNLSQASDYGAKIIYGGVNATPIENLTLGLVVGTADADEVPANYKDDYGVEYDLTLNWNIYDNLSYSAIAAFLDAGDIWKGTGTAEIEDTYALFHQLQLTF